MVNKITRPSADATRQKIIRFAAKLFAKSGYSATTTAAIAKTAKINENLIFHHFNNKSSLWQEVKRFAVMQTTITPLTTTPSSLNEFITDIIQQRISAYRQNPLLIRLMRWQSLEDKKSKLIAANQLAPIQWLPGLTYLQEKKLINKQYNVKMIMLWLAASINAVIFDDAGLFKDNDFEREYINMITQQFTVILGKNP